MQKKKLWKWGIFSVCVLVTFCGGCLSFLREEDYCKKYYVERENIKRKPSDALKELSSCLKVCPRFYPCVENMGLVYMSLGYLQKAKPFFLEAIKNHSFPVISYEALASYYFQEKKYIKSLFFYKGLEKIFQKHQIYDHREGGIYNIHDTRLQIAKIMIFLGNLVEAEHYLKCVAFYCPEKQQLIEKLIKKRILPYSNKSKCE